MKWPFVSRKKHEREIDAFRKLYDISFSRYLEKFDEAQHLSRENEKLKSRTQGNKIELEQERHKISVLMAAKENMKPFAIVPDHIGEIKIRVIDREGARTIGLGMVEIVCKVEVTGLQIRETEFPVWLEKQLHGRIMEFVKNNPII